MEAIGLTAEQSAGQVHFGTCEFGDKRLTDRAVKSMDSIMRHPAGTLPEKFNDRAELNGFYDLANNKKVAHAKVIAGHCQRTLELMKACSGVVLILHDTTEVDFSGLDIEDLGPIGHGGCRGLLCHNSLVLDYANHEVLGLAHQQLHRRREAPKKEKAKAKREHAERESRLWVQGVEGIGKRPEGAVWVDVADRGSDTFEFIEREEQLGRLYAIRSKSDRKIEFLQGGQWKAGKLHERARSLAALSRRTVSVPAREGRAAREAEVRVAAGEVRLLPPEHKRGEHGNQPLRAWVVHVLEENPPPGVEPLEWFLLTNVEVKDAKGANERVDWYCCRWVIEEYHKAQKTGCGMELAQFTTRKALEVTIGMLSVVATLLLRLRDVARRPDAAATAATEVVSVEQVEALSAYLSKNRLIRTDLTAREFLYGLARLGGHQGRRHDGPPGWLVLWRGWISLQLLVEGARGARRKRCT